MPQLDVVTYVFGFPILLVCFQVLYMFNRFSFLPSVMLYSLALDFFREYKVSITNWLATSLAFCSLGSSSTFYLKQWFGNVAFVLKSGYELRVYSEQSKLLAGYGASLLLTRLSFLKK